MTFEPSTDADVHAASERLRVAGHCPDLTRRMLDVLRLVADGVTTHRALTQAMGIRSTNAVAEHLTKLVGRRLLSTRAEPGCPSRYVLTRGGWCALDVCACLRLAAGGGGVIVNAGRWYIVGMPDAIACCPWCGRGAP